MDIYNSYNECKTYHDLRLALIHITGRRYTKSEMKRMIGGLSNRT